MPRLGHDARKSMIT